VICEAEIAKGGFSAEGVTASRQTVGSIILNTETQLGGVPREAWDYRLGNRSALEWVLDHHRERTPKDPTIRERFNTLPLG
jgi:predicted helicase